MCEHGTVVGVTPPAWWHHHRPIIAIDACIVETVRVLWRLRVVTLGSCCGHGRQRPSLVLNNDVEMPSLARAVLADFDPDREWELLQWQLVDVTREIVAT